MGFKLRRLSGWVVFILIIAVSQTFSQVHRSMQDRSYRNGSTTVKYRLFVPANYDPSKKYPLIVTMHGVGERGSDNTRQVDLEDLVSVWIADKIQQETPHFVMGPQCPDNLYWGGVTTQTVHKIIDSLRNEFSLDTNRLYAVGLSMGAREFHSSGRTARFICRRNSMRGAGNNSGSINSKTPLWRSMLR